MANDTHIHHTERPEPPERRSPDWIWVVVALVVVGLIAWFLLGRGDTRTADRPLEVEIEVPTMPAPEQQSPPAQPSPAPSPQPQAPQDN